MPIPDGLARTRNPVLPATPAANADHVPALGRAMRLQAFATHALRAAGIGAGLALLGAIASVVLSVVGVRDCAVVDGDEVCRERQFYPFTLQVKSELTTRNGVPDGPRRDWHPNGEAWFAGSYVGGLRVGTWTEWHANGAPRFTGHYVRDALDGFETWWFDNGQKEWEVERALGRRVGVERWWHDNGQLRREGRYNLRGEKDGAFTVYDESGQERFSGVYQNGVLQSGGDGEAERG